MPLSGDGDGRSCQCVWTEPTNKEWNSTTIEDRTTLFQRQIAPAPPPGLVAYVDGEAAGWIRIGPRSAQRCLARTRNVIATTPESFDDDSVWSVTCFVVRGEHRRRGVNAVLLEARIDFARSLDARVIECYPIDTTIDVHRGQFRRRTEREARTPLGQSRSHGLKPTYDRGMQRRRRTDNLLLWSFLPYIVISIVHVGALAIDSDIASPTKLWLMPLLALPVIVSLRLRPVFAFMLLLAAIVFSWLGDGAGAFFPDGPELPLMLAFFGLAHIAYIVLFVRVLRVRKMPWRALVYAAWWIAMLAVLGPHTGALFFAVAAYGLVLGGTAAFATRCHPLVVWGSIFFLASDTILAFRLFMTDAMPDWTSPLVMLTYTLGQGLIVAGALVTLHARKAR